VPEKVAPVKTASSKTKGSTTKAKTKSGKSTTAQAAADKKTPAPKSYRVKTGDTLYQIALRHGVSVAEILAINSLGGGHIKPGDKLKIPPKTN